MPVLAEAVAKQAHYSVFTRLLHIGMRMKSIKTDENIE